MIKANIEKSSPSLEIDWIKRNHEMIHYFGLGFIQIKLNKNERLHFYTDKLERTVQEEEIHNHRYNFVSEILKGELYQEIYDVEKGKGDYILTQETCNQNDKREFPKVKCSLDLVFAHTFKRGERYFIDHHTFHTVDSKKAITYIKRGDYKKEFADVVFAQNKPSICPFSRKVEEKYLWELVEEELK